MIGPEQQIADSIHLVAPNVERDAPLGVSWMKGDTGHETQRLMGIPSDDIHDHTLDEEQLLIKSFIDTDEEIVWMIQVDCKVVGAVEVGLKDSDEERAPTISIMIGDPTVRGRGVGRKVMTAVRDFLGGQGYKEIHARYVTDNIVSEKMNTALGFVAMGEPYQGSDGLMWQNVRYERARDD